MNDLLKYPKLIFSCNITTVIICPVILECIDALPQLFTRLDHSYIKKFSLLLFQCKL